MTLAFLPARTGRALSAAGPGLNRAALRSAMYGALRTTLRPPATRRTRCRSLLSLDGAGLASAA
jgi:hypothetical protein